jgi:hypothetical protein
LCNGFIPAVHTRHEHFRVQQKPAL